MLSEEKVREIFDRHACMPTRGCSVCHVGCASILGDASVLDFASDIEKAVKEALHVEEWETRRCECGAKDACAFARERDVAIAALDDAIKEERERCIRIAQCFFCETCDDKGGDGCGYCNAQFEKAILTKLDEEGGKDAER